MIRWLIVPLTLCLFAAPVAADQMVDNPQYAQWSSFKVGASVTFVQNIKAGPTVVKTETTTTLKSKAAGKIVVTDQAATFMTIPGQGEKRMETPAIDREIPAKFKQPAPQKPHPNAPKPVITKGQENVTVGGKSLACEWVQTVMKSQGSEVTSKVWSSKSVPGHMVKMTSSTKGAGGTSNTEMVATKFKVP